ncbi:MAG: SRPBCC domain-containing protein [Desulfatiglandales bacterium]|nr:SRPBCC domain-containing protein [Desulfatiglandales bacterium]
MITIENILIAEKDIKTIWSFFNDINSIAGCVPTCVAHEVIDEDTVSCDLRIKLGMIPLDNKAKVKITERRDDWHLEAKGQTEAGDMMKKFGKVVTDTVTNLHIILDLEELGPNQTRIHFCINADAVGQMRRIYEAVIKGQREKIENQFVENIENALVAKVVMDEMPLSAVAGK